MHRRPRVSSCSPTARCSRASSSGRPGVGQPARSCSTRRMTGYQEIITDPSYAGQIITFTNPHIGNYGVERRGLRVGAGCSAAASSFATWPAGRATAAPRATSTRCCARYGDPRDHRHRHPPADPTDPRHRRHARRVRPGRRVDAVRPRRGRRARHRRHRPRRHGHDAERRTRVGDGGGRRIVAFDYGIKRTILRHLAGLGTVEVVPGRHAGRRRRWPASPTASSCPTVPATRRWSAGAVDDHRRAARRRCRSSASASATSCSARPSAARRSSCRSATTAPTTRCATSRPGAIEITSQNHNFAVATDRLDGSADDDPRQPQRRRVRGAARRSDANACSACSTTPRPVPARTTAATCSPASPT